MCSLGMLLSCHEHHSDNYRWLKCAPKCIKMHHFKENTKFFPGRDTAPSSPRAHPHSLREGNTSSLDPRQSAHSVHPFECLRQSNPKPHFWLWACRSKCSNLCIYSNPIHFISGTLPIRSRAQRNTEKHSHIIIDFPNLGSTYNGGWLHGYWNRWNTYRRAFLRS